MERKGRIATDVINRYVKHATAANKAEEETFMWNEWKRDKGLSDRSEESSASRRLGIGSKADVEISVIKTNKNDPERWGHGGFLELHPELQVSTATKRRRRNSDDDPSDSVSSSGGRSSGTDDSESHVRKRRRRSRTPKGTKEKKDKKHKRDKKEKKDKKRKRDKKEKREKTTREEGETQRR